MSRIELPFPAWQAGTLTIVLHLQRGGLIHVSFTTIISSRLYLPSRLLYSYFRQENLCLLFVSFETRFKIERSWWDSNPRSPPWQGGIHSNWTARPFQFPIFYLWKLFQEILQGSFFWIEQNKTILYLLYEPLCLFFIKISKNYIFIYFCAIERNRTSTYWGFNPTTLPLSYDDIYHRFGTMVRTCTWNHYSLGSGVHHHFIGVLIKVAI